MRRLMKIRHMSPREIGSRCGDAARRYWERMHWRRGTVGLPSSTDIDGDHLLRSARSLVPGTDRSELEMLRRVRPILLDQMTRDSTSKAESVLTGCWRMLGHEFDLTGAIDWHRDPRSTFRWPADFYADLPLAGLPDGVDVKYVWELGRHQFTVELARAWLLTGERSYVSRVREILLDWIEKNPLHSGIHWTSGLEVAVRGIAWIWVLSATSAWNGWNAGDLRRIAASLIEHARYLERNFSFYSSPYNHLMGEATALFLLGRLLLDDPASGHWRKLGRKVLETHGPGQFHADGFCVEQATGYHYYTLGFLSLAVAASRPNEPLNGLEEILRKAYRTGAAFRRSDGLWPVIGDADSARSIPVRHDEHWNFDSLGALSAVLFGDASLQSNDDDPGPELYWLLGCEGVREWQKLPAAEAPRRLVLKRSGYVVARGRGDSLLFDAGPVAAGLHAGAAPSVAHGHADTFQVLYTRNAKPVLTDPGMPFYGGKKEWVDYFRAADAHNTFQVDGVGPVRAAGRLAWSHEAPPPTFEADLTESAWVASGRAEWGGGVVVERHVLVLPGYGLWIGDVVLTSHPRRVRWHWQFPGGSPAVPCDVPGGRGLRIGDVVLACWRATGVADFMTDRPTPGSPVALDAAGYGTWRPALRVSCETTAERCEVSATFIGSAPFAAEFDAWGRTVVCAPVEPTGVSATYFMTTSMGARWRVFDHGDRVPHVNGRSR